VSGNGDTGFSAACLVAFQLQRAKDPFALPQPGGDDEKQCLLTSLNGFIGEKSFARCSPTHMSNTQRLASAASGFGVWIDDRT
jgi:hypothetical protein